MSSSSPSGWYERAAYFLYRKHRFRNALILALCTFLVPVGIALAIGGPSSDALLDVPYRGVQESISELLTVAQVMGGVYSILLAVIVFSVQLHAQREDESAFMVRYLNRKHGVFWVAAAAVGVTLVNASVPLGRSLGLSINLPTLLVFDLVAVPATLLLSLWLLTMTIRDATAPTFDSTLEPFKRDLTLAIASDQFGAAMASEFQAALAKTRFEYNNYAAELTSTASRLSNHKRPAC
jgi:cytochrome bd-type quinol oxidase subunit 2